MERNVPILLMNMNANYLKGKSCKIKSKLIILMFMLFSMHMSANHLTIEIQENALLFYNTDNLLGLNISLTKSGSILLGEPEKFSSNMMIATNINDTVYKVAMAGADSPEKETPFLKIPYTGEGTIDFELKVNGELIETSLTLPFLFPLLQNQYKNKVFLGGNMWLYLQNASYGFYNGYKIIWHHNQDTIDSNNNRAFLFNDFVTEKDTGYYFITVTHPIFSNYHTESNKIHITFSEKQKGDFDGDYEQDEDDAQIYGETLFDILSNTSEIDTSFMEIADMNVDGKLCFIDFSLQLQLVNDIYLELNEIDYLQVPHNVGLEIEKVDSSLSVTTTSDSLYGFYLEIKHPRDVGFVEPVLSETPAYVSTQSDSVTFRLLAMSEEGFKSGFYCNIPFTKPFDSIEIAYKADCLLDNEPNSITIIDTAYINNQENIDTTGTREVPDTINNAIFGNAKKLMDFRCYPNPVEDYLYIECNNSTREKIICEIVDVTGRVLFRKEETFSPGNNHFTINKNQINYRGAAVLNCYSKVSQFCTLIIFK